jgi:hypothetical protein
MTDLDILEKKVVGDFSSENGFSNLAAQAKHTLRRKQIVLYNWPAAEAANANTDEVFCYKANANIQIEALEIYPAANLTAHNSNLKTITVAKRPSNGAAATTIVAMNTATSAAGGTGNWTSFVAVSLTISNTTLATVTSGQSITMSSILAASGVAIGINTRLVMTYVEL